MAVIDFLAPLKDHSTLTNLDLDSHPGALWMDGRAVPIQYAVFSTLAGGGGVLMANDSAVPGQIDMPPLFIDQYLGRIGVNSLEPLETMHIRGTLRVDNDIDALGRAFVLGSVTPGAPTGTAIGLVKFEYGGQQYALPVYSLNGSTLPGGTVTEGGTLNLLWNVAAATSNPGDTFARATHGALDGSTSSSGHTWNVYYGGDGSFVTVDEGAGGKARSIVPRTGTHQFAGLSGMSANGTLEFVISGIDGTKNQMMGAVLRYDDTAKTAYILECQAANTKWKLRAWTFADPGSQPGGYTDQDITATPADGDTVQVVLATDNYTIRIKPSGGSFSDYGPYATTALNTTSIIHGLLGYAYDNSDAIRIDNVSWVPA